MPFTDKTIADIYYEWFAAYGVARVMRHEKWIDAIIDAKKRDGDMPPVSYRESYVPKNCTD